MQLIDTEFGRLFYCIYTLHKRQLISQDRKGRLKDLLITTDDRMTPLLTNVKQYNEQQVYEHLLMIVDSPHDTYLKQESEPSEENQSINSARTSRIPKPKEIFIEKSTFKLAEKSPGPLSTRSSQKRLHHPLKILENI
ncbi:unnamed protein product (macronuclear) [Paramecium tetraurelia]|uniref:Uncharacterized protein n=1 Tax=Paramecium tetraurelia TaxID=5888 RepID=A0D7Q2_PARTE|nr:uncharacterized protein GSPATT00014036001 [Paramecium tetraurelia]CAK79069.1 unnamed protein product [Paramecium tetraurelia]|eukprot:XP_001446466.1 hypothetical protein (macronuclear) [Paramecium tetraurelia strain d4-2]